MVHPDTVDVSSKRPLTEVSYDHFTYRAVVGVRFWRLSHGPWNRLLRWWRTKPDSGDRGDPVVAGLDLKRRYAGGPPCVNRLGGVCGGLGFASQITIWTGCRGCARPPIN